MTNPTPNESPADLPAHAVIRDVIADAFDISKSSASIDAETVIVCLRDHGWEITRRGPQSVPGAPAAALDLENAEFVVKTLEAGNWSKAAGVMQGMISEIRRLHFTLSQIRLPAAPKAPSATPQPGRVCTCLGSCKGAEGLSPGWTCALLPTPPAPRSEP